MKKWVLLKSVKRDIGEMRMPRAIKKLFQEKKCLNTVEPFEYRQNLYFFAVYTEFIFLIIGQNHSF